MLQYVAVCCSGWLDSIRSVVSFISSCSRPGSAEFGTELYFAAISRNTLQRTETHYDFCWSLQHITYIVWYKILLITATRCNILPCVRWFPNLPIQNHIWPILDHCRRTGSTMHRRSIFIDVRNEDGTLRIPQSMYCAKLIWPISIALCQMCHQGVLFWNQSSEVIFFKNKTCII